ncbi:MAG: hypothetical protein AB1512_18655 [Thermodesulfobacteriota bacterium]
MFQPFPFNTPQIHFGFDTIEQLGQEVEKLGGGSILDVAKRSSKGANPSSRPWQPRSFTWDRKTAWGPR